MLAVDWLGLALSGALLALALRGPRRPLRAALAVLLGEAGRALVVLLAGDTLTAMTLGGAFTRVATAGLPPLAVQAGGPLAGAALGLVLGKRMARDTLVYTALAGGILLVLRR